MSDKYDNEDAAYERDINAEIFEDDDWDDEGDVVETLGGGFMDNYGSLE